MTKITAIATQGDSLAFTLDNGHAYYTDESYTSGVDCEDIWFPLLSNSLESDDYDGVFAIGLVNGKLQFHFNGVQVELHENSGACQGDAECVSVFNGISELKAFFEGHTVSFNSNGQLVASYKGCEEALIESIA